jgi:hypothetical protein
VTPLTLPSHPRVRARLQWHLDRLQSRVKGTPFTPEQRESARVVVKYRLLLERGSTPAAALRVAEAHTRRALALEAACPAT